MRPEIKTVFSRPPYPGPAGRSHALTVTYLIPVFAILWATLFLDERLTLVMLIGGGLVLTGVGLANARRRG